ncbi:MAG: rod shape-determining protein RodA [Spirochaetaceae bacterium]|nr:MAG: rod shape-determining protein RodA [Spirochaetaceae bacterium]
MKRVSLFAFDFILLGATLILLLVGILFVYSSGMSFTGMQLSNEYVKQLIWAGSGLLLMTGVILIDFHRLRRLSIYFYGFMVVLLLVTPFIGREVHGARSWIGVGEFGIQPSEFAKISTILFLASYLTGIGKGIRELPRFLLGLAIVVLPIGLILLQPDMGTALVYIPIFLFVAFISGAKLRHLVFLTAAGLLTIILAVLPLYEQWIVGREATLLSMFTDFQMARYYLAALLVIALLSAWGFWGFKRRYFYWILYVSSLLLLANAGALLVVRFLRDYQIMRFIVFLNPRIDPQGAGWNLIQSVTAVGSGGFMGKGFLQGTQSHYQFLPQQSTDFIFSILAEEWGFLGGLLVFALFLIILLRGIRILYIARDEYAMRVGAGIVAMFFFHVIVNVGMAMGIMPITGIPLFFLSYGGSSLWTGLICIGLMLNFYFRRYGS